MEFTIKVSETVNHQICMIYYVFGGGVRGGDSAANNASSCGNSDQSDHRVGVTSIDYGKLGGVMVKNVDM